MLAIALLFDAVVLCVFFYRIPEMKRPLEFLCITTGILGVSTAFAAGEGRLRNLSLLVVVLSGTLFGLEMAQKVFNITEIFESAPDRPVAMENDHSWNPRSSPEYLAVRERAIQEMGDHEGLRQDFAGDVFHDRDKSSLVVKKSRGGTKLDMVEALREPYVEGPPLGFELTPDNLIRHSCRDRASGIMLWDGYCTVNSHGFRETRGDADAAETVIFLGCSVTFGYGVSDDQTTPHHFNAGYDFNKRVLNFAASNYGPHQALRELELDYHASRAGVRPERVVAVYYGLIDDHANRVVRLDVAAAPNYVLRGGRAVFAGHRTENPVLGRFSLMLDRSRIYPVMRDKLMRKWHALDGDYRWELTHAILAEVDRTCRERYGVGLTVVYWNEDPRVEARLRNAGIAVVRVANAFGEEWKKYPVLYNLADGHPSAYSHRLLGEYLYRLRENQVPETNNN